MTERTTRSALLLKYCINCIIWLCLHSAIPNHSSASTVAKPRAQSHRQEQYEYTLHDVPIAQDELLAVHLALATRLLSLLLELEMRLLHFHNMPMPVVVQSETPE